MATAVHRLRSHHNRHRNSGRPDTNQYSERLRGQSTTILYAVLVEAPSQSVSPSPQSIDAGRVRLAHMNQ